MPVSATVYLHVIVWCKFVFLYEELKNSNESYWNEQRFQVVLFDMLYKVVLFKCIDVNPHVQPSNESYTY